MSTVALNPAAAKTPAALPEARPARGLRAAGVLLGAQLRKHAATTRAYAFNAVMSMVGMYMFFFMVFMGTWVAFGDTAGYDAKLSEVVVRMVVWMMALQAFQEVANNINAEATQGTLEQVAMSPFGLGRVLLLRACSTFAIQFVFTSVFMLLMMVTTGRWLHLDPVSLVPLLFVTIMGAHGIGLAMGGLALVFKRMSASFGLLQFMFMALVAVPREKFAGVVFFPLALGTQLIREVMIDRASILRMDPLLLLGLLANSACYLAAGYGVFRLLERVARGRGLLGHY